ncbi:MAG: 4Fe-4S dicluster domain-containing protein [Pseudohaliea sp.]
MPLPAESFAVIDRCGLDALLAALRAAGFRTVGPTPGDDAIVCADIETTADLPAGCGDEQAPGHYRLHRGEGKGFFRHNPGPDSWKKYFFPPRRRLWALQLRDGVFEPVGGEVATPRYALIGPRACDLAALAVQDRVFRYPGARDEHYLGRRAASFIVAVNCGQAAATCFCDAMGTGPRCEEGFDLALTEFAGDDRHEFLVERGTPAGEAMLASVPARPAREADLERARAATAQARAQQPRKPAAATLPGLLARNREHPRWEEIADRCLACGNCTLACPTCFCSDIEDTADLTGAVAERWQQWGSCFNASFSYTHGGSMRGSTAARYRQWLTHKLSAWVEQFGSSGCVGCGRCITWCPVGIDLTEEVAVIAARDGERSSGAPGATGGRV